MTKTGHLYETRLPNGSNGDPLIYCLSQRTGDALLLDLGDLTGLGNKEILKVRQVAVTHTHIDHFIGFDRLLRVNVPHFRSLEFCGPPGLAENIFGKMRGYCWNLLEPGQINLTVHEVKASGAVSSFILSNDLDWLRTLPSKDHMFQPRALPARKQADEATGTPARPLKPAGLGLILPDGSHVHALVLDHGTPVCAYMIESPTKFLVNADALTTAGLPAGPWIRELQLAMAGNDSERIFTVGGKSWRAEQLGSLILERAASRTLAYLTDFVFSQDNVARLRSRFHGVLKVICETNYRDVDKARALQKKHLTTRQGALLAAALGAHEMETFHISNLYLDDLEQVKKEAQEFFASFKSMTVDRLEQEIRMEIT